MKKPIVFIFDFDGTIADSLDVILKILNRLSKDYGYKHITDERKAILRDETSQTIIKDISISRLRLPFFIRRVRNEMTKDFTLVHPVSGMKKTLEDLHNDGFVLGIATSNSRKIVKTFLSEHDLTMFDFVYAKTVFSKAKLLQSIVNRHKYDNATVYYIGDETRDIEAAKTAGLKTIAVSWGMNSAKRLEQSSPDYLIHSPHELIKITKK